MNGRYPLLIHAENVNLLSENEFHTETENLYYTIICCRHITEKTKCSMITSCHQTAGKTTVTTQNCNNEEIKTILNSENVYYSVVRNILASRLVSKD